MSLGSKKLTEFWSGAVKRKHALMFEETLKSSSPGSAKKRRISREVPGQMALDAGQAKIGAQKCDKVDKFLGFECRMVYSVDVLTDAEEHLNFCTGAEKRRGLFVKRCIVDAWVKRVLSLPPGHPAYPLTGTCTLIFKVERGCLVGNLKAKVEEVVKNQVNELLGYTEDGSMWDSKLSRTYCDPLPASSSQSPSRPLRKAYLTIMRDEKGSSWIAGVLVAEAVYRAIDVDGKKMIRADRLMGVNRLWVNEEMRGRGIATKMVDAARESFYSLVIPCSRVVFSEPTKDGERFARSYVRNDGGRLLVYNLGDGERWNEIMKKMVDTRRRSQHITVENSLENTVDRREE